MQAISRTLSFPVAGVSASQNYRKQEPPYTTPLAINVRGIDVIERRLRGGSRPGLVKVLATKFNTPIQGITSVNWIDGDGDPRQDVVIVAKGDIFVVREDEDVTEDPTLDMETTGVILAEDGTDIVFGNTVSQAGTIGSASFDSVERNGMLLIADTVLRQYSPASGIVGDVLAKTGSTIPAGQPLICRYRDRVFLAGENNVWYCSRQSDITDWDYGADFNDDGRAVIGAVSDAGRIGCKITAMIANNGDSSMLFSTENSIWMLTGDPATGDLRCISHEVGAISPTAWASSPDGLTLFLSCDGVYVVAPGIAVSRFSERLLPSDLRNVDASANTISMAYDSEFDGFHLFISPNTGLAGSHWWIDNTNKAMWRVTTPIAGTVEVPINMNPVAASRMVVAGRNPEVIIGCKDGYLRKFSAAATTDDGQPIASKIFIGPVPLCSDDAQDAMIDEIHGIIGNAASGVSYKVFTGKYAEDVVDKASAYQSGTETAYAASGTWAQGRNKVVRVRARDPWCMICVEGTGIWTYEAIAITGKRLGRIR